MFKNQFVQDSWIPCPPGPAPRNGLPLQQWPPGCLGYVVNLVRPAHRGHRSTVFYSQLGRALVFESLDQAAQYREYVTQVTLTINPKCRLTLTLNVGAVPGVRHAAGPSTPEN